MEIFKYLVPLWGVKTPITFIRDTTVKDLV